MNAVAYQQARSLEGDLIAQQRQDKGDPEVALAASCAARFGDPLPPAFVFRFREITPKADQGAE